MRDPSMIASDPDISAWVAANAGAGKTYTLANRVARLLQRIAFYDDPAVPYYPRVRPFSTDSVGDYDHLARVREWSASGWAQEE